MPVQFLKKSEGSIAYESTGAGPLVVATPSLGDVRAEYRFLTPQLVAAGYRVVTMDLRGHGESSTGWSDYSVAATGQDIIDLILSLNAGPAILIGESMSAGAAVWAAVEAPELVKALVLVGPAVHGEVSWSFHLLMRVLFTRPWGAAAWGKYFNSLFPTRKPGDLPAYTAALVRSFNEPGRLEDLYQTMIAPKTASAERLSRVSVPSLVLMGTKDPDFKDPAAEAAWVANQVHGRQEMIEGAGHYPQVEMPEIAGPKILEFLKTVAGEPTHVTFAG